MLFRNEEAPAQNRPVEGMQGSVHESRGCTAAGAVPEKEKTRRF